MRPGFVMTGCNMIKLQTKTGVSAYNKHGLSGWANTDFNFVIASQ
jgi:hypothetical protein